MKGCRLLGILSLVSLIMIGVFLLFFGCSHWHNWWPLFIFPTMIFAIIVPGCCYNYNAIEDIPLRQDQHVDEVTFRNCRELGNVIALLLFVFCYAIPVLAWYNEAYSYAGVLVEFASITCFCWAYVLWLRIFVFI